jgi:hypothetical protein
VGSPCIITETPRQVCPTQSGQAGTKMYCNGRVLGYDLGCSADQYYSDGSVKHYSNCVSSVNNSCQGEVTCPAPATTTTQTTPTLPAQGAPTVVTVSNNNTNTNSNTNNNNITVQGGGTREVVREVRTFGNVGVGGSATTYYANVKQLPSTGLPLAAWAAAAFIPAGFRIRRFSKVKEDALSKPSYLWESRQFHKE